MNKKFKGSLILAKELYRLGIDNVIFNCTEDSHKAFVKEIGGEDYLVSDPKLSKMMNVHMYLYLGITFYFVVQDNKKEDETGDNKSID